MGIDSYNVVWDSPSESAAGSMPLGNGDIGLNVWVEKGRGLLFYIGKTDSWEENCRLAKVGLVRVEFAPDPFEQATAFRQELNLATGEIAITVGAGFALHIWVDANHPVVNVTVDNSEPLTVTTSFELWRSRREELSSIEISDIYYDHDLPSHMQAPTIVEPDTVLTGIGNRVGWFHRNEKSAGPALTMDRQDLLRAPWHDPILHRTFGAVIQGEHVERLGDHALASVDRTHHRFAVVVHAKQPATASEWKAETLAIAGKLDWSGFEHRRHHHRSWWHDFWSRSHVSIWSTDSIDSSGHDVSRGYNLQRFVNACGGRGAFPIKFNGSIFTVPFPGAPGDADYRRWGPGFWWQNIRLAYEGMCASGDLDLMRPLFSMYAEDIRKVCEYRTRHYFGIEGAYFPECMYPWGAVFMESYGWGSRAADREDKLQVAGWH